MVMKMVQSANEHNNPAFADFAPPIRAQSELRQRITAAYRIPEVEAVRPLLDEATLPEEVTARIRETAPQADRRTARQAQGLRRRGAGA
jgi:RHH-type proline utilization regulon transcriptional repressor/proline dehydrogenase/delta 1-pyrroline-5-carboxylate dehydrogenase